MTSLGKSKLIFGCQLFRGISDDRFWDPCLTHASRSITCTRAQHLICAQALTIQGLCLPTVGVHRTTPLFPHQISSPTLDTQTFTIDPLDSRSSTGHYSASKAIAPLYRVPVTNVTALALTMRLLSRPFSRSDPRVIVECSDSVSTGLSIDEDACARHR